MQTGERSSNRRSVVKVKGISLCLVHSAYQMSKNLQLQEGGFTLEPRKIFHLKTTLHLVRVLKQENASVAELPGVGDLSLPKVSSCPRGMPSPAYELMCSKKLRSVGKGRK